MTPHAVPSGNRKITVIGAGVVGMACAVTLQRDGHDVTVIDRLPPGEACSFGNAGGIASSHALPFQTPGILRKVPGYLLDPLGPLAIRPAHLPKLVPFLMRFLRASSGPSFVAVMDALCTFMRGTFEAWKPWIKEAGLEEFVAYDGGITPYTSERMLGADMKLWQLLIDRGMPIERLGRDELRQLEPTLSDRYVCAMFEPEFRRSLNPYLFPKSLAELFVRKGGTLLREQVSEIEIGPDGPRALRTNHALHPVDLLVVAAGAWSKHLAAQLGSRVPLESARGYHITIPEPGVAPRHVLIMPDYQLAISPMAMGLRLAGTAELAGLDSPPDYRRARKLVEIARRVFPDINTEGYTQWAGDRPLTPDSLPVIGPSPHHRNVLYAFGHGHYGLTGAALTGQIVTDLAAGRPSSIDISPFRIDRF